VAGVAGDAGVGHLVGAGFGDEPGAQGVGAVGRGVDRQAVDEQGLGDEGAQDAGDGVGAEAAAGFAVAVDGPEERSGAAGGAPAGGHRGGADGVVGGEGVGREPRSVWGFGPAGGLAGSAGMSDNDLMGSVEAGGGGGSPVRVGMIVPGEGSIVDGRVRRRLINLIADSGLDYLVVTDHVSFRGGAGSDGLIAAAMSLGCRPDLPVYVGVYLLALRQPVLVARQVVDLAAFAPGQLTLGVGVGGEDRHEIEVCGVDPATRGRRMDECLEVLRQLLTGAHVTLEGAHVRLRDAAVLPAPLSPVPVVVGGRSAAATRRAALLGDGWVGVWVSAQRFAAVTDEIARTARDAGRLDVDWDHGLNVWCGLGHDDPRGSLARRMQAFYQLPFAKFERWSPHGTPADVADFLAPYITAGCRSFNLMPCGTDADEMVHAAAEVRHLLIGDQHDVAHPTPGSSPDQP
jgi:alkanesulfonate monooxygenase SsuD/methylene tetrahydromethanopterin reductase-like flavin-dependent oxidoreductase (luciferase family)